ncbi:MAG: zf-HC2 domain-containing protein [Acidobacteria bacterium]|nr:zf-HC2 domain-containing protein [Acidobacteriota bacterium]
MNCEKYQNLISQFLDGELEPNEVSELETHCSICVECSKLREDFESILNFSDETLSAESAPPNSQALWCRINNIIETDIKAEIAAEVNEEKAPKGFFRKFAGSSWNLSPSQVLTSVIGVALVSSLITIVAVQNFSGPTEVHTGIEMQPNIFETALSKVGLMESAKEKHLRRINEQKSAIAYWRKRVEMRKVQWDSHLQTAFDRNLKEIDKVVNEYTKILQENPQDKISSEMLDSALSEKMEFLREFAEL